MAFFERVREGYLAMAKKEPEVFCVIDGTKSEEQVWGEVRGKMEEWV